MLADWSSFAAALPKSKGTQSYEDRPVARKETFVPAIQRNFSCSVLGCFAKKSPPAAAVMIRLLTEFGEMVGAPPDEIARIECTLAMAKTEASILVALVHAYTLQGYFYRELNRALRDDHEVRLLTVGPVIPRLMAGLAMVPFVGTVFRGFSATAAEAAVYSKGLVFLWPGFTSTSTSLGVALSFAKGNGEGAAIVFQIEIASADCCAGDIQSMSFFKGESEVLMSPYTSLSVRKTTVADDVTVVECSALSSLHNMTGVWTCSEDMGTYYISQIESNVVWLAVGPRFTHVFFGRIKHRMLEGTFADLPCDAWRFNGTIVVSIDKSFSKMSLVQEKSPNFLGQSFVKKKSHVDQEEAPNLKHCKVASDSGLTGQWISDKGLTYFVRQVNASSLFWFAYTPNDWSAANIFWGTWDAQLEEYSGMFSDLILSTRFRYAGKLTVRVAGTTMQIRATEGAYMCQSLTQAE